MQETRGDVVMLIPGWRGGRLRGWLRELAGPAAVALTLMVLLALGWRRWGDPVVDFGREVYTAWQVSEGRVLNEDVHTIFGPLSIALNGLLFRVFGPQLLTLIWTNIFVLFLVAACIYGIVRELSTRLAATACGIMFACISATAHLTQIGIFSFISPYSHELTHGLALSLLALWCYLRHTKGESLAWLMGAGLCVGLTFLTKPEIFVATAGGLISGIAWMRGRAVRWRQLASMIGVAVIPILLSAIIFGWRTTLGSWHHLIGYRMVGLPYNLQVMGLDSPVDSILYITNAGGFFISILGIGYIAARPVANKGGWRRAWCALGGVAIVGVAWAAVFYLHKPQDVNRWLQIGAILPLVVGGLLIWKIRYSKGHVERRQSTVIVSALALALLLLMKLGLLPRIYLYGFALALPAMMIFVVFMLDVVPRYLEERGRSGWMMRGFGLALLALVAGKALEATWQHWGEMRFELGKGADRMLVDQRGKALAEALEFLERETKEGETITPLPEGVMIDFLLKRRSGSAYVSFVPLEVATYGEVAMLRDLQSRKPDWIVIVDRETPDYGRTRFGVDDGEQIAGWVAGNYREVRQIGERPMTRKGFGVLILRRL